MASKRYVVTGCLGFIGGHVTEALLKRGDDVIGIDNRNDYYSIDLKNETQALLEQTSALSHSGSFHFFEKDLRSQENIQFIFETYQVDAIVHLAAQAGVRYSIDHSVDVLHSNVESTLNILELATKWKVPHLVIASSSSVYGSGCRPPFTENQQCTTPMSPYAASKLACEHYAFCYHHLHHFSVTNLRFFTVYGPRGRPDMAVAKFIDLIDRKKPIQVYGDGSAQREFTYISDIVDGVLQAIDRPNGWQVVNLGGGSTHTVNELIACIEASLGTVAKKEFTDVIPGDMTITQADQTLARLYLNFRPNISLKEGIRRTVEWYYNRSKKN